MSISKIVDVLAKTLFAIACIGMIVAFLELLAQFAGASLVFELYTPGRLIELSAMLLIFVIAVELMHIRDELGAGNR